VGLASEFDALQQEANADEDQVREARRRRNVILDAFATEEDVSEMIRSGSLARGSQIDPIHDVDLIIVFDAAAYPSWGQPGASAEDALTVVQARVQALVGATQGSVANEVRLARIGNHAVKCFLDDPDDPNAFTVDLMPALRHETSGLVVPERASKDWIRTDPDYLNELVGGRHAVWNEFVKLIRVLKRWNRDHGRVFKSLTIEVLALKCLHEAPRPEALARFFEAARAVIFDPITDPAELCGEIQPSLDRNRAHELLGEAAQGAWAALDAEAEGDEDEARKRWHSVLGDAFPTPPEGGSTPSGTPAVIGAPAVFIPRTPRPVVDAPQG
jgi:hypothetical protein